MSNIGNSLYNIDHLDDLAKNNTFIHKLHPLVKLVTTLAFLVVVASFGKYEIARLFPLFFYPVIVISLAELPPAPILKRILVVEPFVVGIGILNPLFEKQTFVLGGFTFSAGWITLMSIFVKSILALAAVFLLVATTGMNRLAAALRMLKIPKLFVLQLMLTYRYISVLLEEAERMLRAYMLRSPLQNGIHIKDWGAFAGQLVLRTFDRAQRVYQAMCVRGFTGEYNTGERIKFKASDIVYLVGWLLFFAMARMYDIPVLIGTFFTGVIR
ncbi:MAG TPA: cobalt ECF transporter T component CbiQ [Hungateiclostridium thermocellum]|jgi:cobalt/nickel transport system permease protein|uniref:Cobalt ABC transporter, inner membrane subunit CbiQ n=2 Tax=Acetivibrio thermocellus TaxID=1515 RepID=A3DGE4_ACET2|nr:cobalt ECF transporter T component CbiQ [Acetivibrio thermocellus]CDG36324.1 cobalt ABC transporter inner membrane subunit CbiQ [Acetivibrio thermocellus BC1]ABN53023.1 cobalt ABC transporter, inner membrane subunit CbiQ [Acetivibrio thermocellus ATCC 27405]ADU75488.1 cobalt ABC transporter, inner membrane subunit CbiQ [Acetivibrio thermocellus DSM 1313]ALX09489.1 cobalt ABC transporter, inner membrane subunit CbiQ [Acetivibrio thermocellus AD2]ANV77243.1 cobalt ABC transporter, inner membr